MKSRVSTMRPLLLIFISLLVHFSASASASPLSSTFSYQFVVVDASSTGSDHNCNMLNVSSTTGGSASFQILPCSTIKKALQLFVNDDIGSYWILMRPGSYQVPDITLPLRSLTLSIYLPDLPTGTSFTFPAWLTTGISRVTWDCMGSQNCVTSALPGLMIRGVSIRNVTTHAVYHTGTLSQLTDITLAEVDCQFSGGLLYKTHGNVTMTQVQLLNATNYGFDTPLALVHLNNTNVSIADCEFRNMQLNGNYISPAGVMYVISSVGWTSFTMVRSIFDNNVVRADSGRYHTDSMHCAAGPGLGFNVTDIAISIDLCDFANHVAYGVGVCGGALGVFPKSDAGRSVDIQLTSTRFWNNAFQDAFGISSDGQGTSIMIAADSGYFDASKLGLSTPSFSLRNCSFFNNTAKSNGGIALQRVRQVQLIDSVFIANSGPFGSAILSVDGLYDSNLVSSGLFVIRNCTFDSNTPPSVSITTSSSVMVDGSTFRNANDGQNSGGIALVKTTSQDFQPVLTMTNCEFFNNTGRQGGGLSISSGIGTITNTTFASNGGQMGGALYIERSNIKIYTSNFINNYVYFQQTSVGVVTMEGGAIYAVATELSIQNSVFTNSTVKVDGGLQTCAGATSGTTMSATYRGGAISLRETFLTLMDSMIEDSSACCGADIYSDGNSVYLIDTSFSNSRSYVGGSLAMKDVNTLFVTAAQFFNVSSYSHGGSMIFSSVSQFQMSYSSFANISSQTGDGGVIYIAGMNVFASNSVFENTFTYTAAPLGGGGIVFFSSLYGGAVQSFGFTDVDANTITQLPGEFVKWGEKEATNVFVITSSLQDVVLYPGQAFSQYIFGNLTVISITAVDGFNQTVRGDRGMVIQCSLSQVDGLPIRTAKLSGTVLRQMTSAAASADFSDLTIAAEPGAYQLTFSVVGTPSVPSINVGVVITDRCPDTLFYSRSTASCTSCPSALLVYEASSEGCLPCEQGRVVTAQQVCAICDLGSTNYGSSDCVKCGSNTYQPTPLATCASCLDVGMDGLKCSDGLAEVEAGYFAYSVFLNGSSTPSLQTAQCPEGYCSGSFVQANWTDPSKDFINNSALTIVPYFASAVTRFDQCAYPRLAAEDNYLCGACAPGLIEWGERCSKCDHEDKGRMAIFIFLTFAVVLFLVRASLSNASAAHTTILLYFVQTSMLEVGSSSNLINWGKFSLLSPSAFYECLAPLSVYQQSVFQMLMPLFMLGELVVVMILHFAWFQFRKHTGVAVRPNSSTNNPAQGNSAPIRSRFLWVIDSFSVDLYVSAALAILLFTYTQVTLEAFRLLACVDVAGVSVVFTQPTMRCDSAAYKSHKVLIGWVIAYVALLPIALFLFLWRNVTLVQMSHDLMKFEDADVAFARHEQSSSSSSSTKAAAHSVAAPSAAVIIEPAKPSQEDVSRFLLRYSPIFSMYSSRSYFWTSVLLARRIVFVAISVGLVRRTGMKFFAFGFSHLLSLLLCVYFRPYELTFFNAAEVGFHVILILLSQSLTAILPPLTGPTQMFLLMLLVLPVGLYLIFVLIERYIHHRKRRSLDELVFARGSVAAESGAGPVSRPLPSNHSAKLDDVQLNGKAEISLQEHDTAGVTASAYVLPEYVTRSEDSSSHAL